MGYKSRCGPQETFRGCADISIGENDTESEDTNEIDDAIDSLFKLLINFFNLWLLKLIQDFYKVFNKF